MRIIYDWLFGIEEVSEEIEADQKTIDNRNKLLKEVREFDIDLLLPSEPPKKVDVKKIYKRKKVKKKILRLDLNK